MAPDGKRFLLERVYPTENLARRVDGGFYPVFDWRVAELREALRSATLKAFVRWEKLSSEAADTIAGWDIERCGFSLFVGPPIDDRDRLGGLLRYLFRSPVSFKRLDYQESTGKVRLKRKRGEYRECPLLRSEPTTPP